MIQFDIKLSKQLRPFPPFYNTLNLAQVWQKFYVCMWLSPFLLCTTIKPQVHVTTNYFLQQSL